tara:strand:+ start:1452 stop:2144 length:693 start_codon:yes stop_codon:yes gene_type:complete
MNYSFPVSRRLDTILEKLNLESIIKFKNKLKTQKNLRVNESKTIRKLEIGPGLERISDFETLNIIDGQSTDYILDLSKVNTPFKDNSFDLIYCSHIMEHMPWYEIDKIFIELYRMLKPNGILEVWVPDGLKVCKNIIEFEENEINNTELDGWYRLNENKDPIKWGAARMFSYGDGLGNLNHHNWHRGLFTEKYLNRTFSKVGFKNIKKMDNSEVRGYDHGWINLGIKGVK